MMSQLRNNMPAAVAGFILATLFMFWIDFAAQSSWVIRMEGEATSCHLLP